MLSLTHYLLTICIITTQAADLKSSGYFSFGKFATPLHVCINRKENGVAKSIKYYCNADQSGVLSGEWDGFDCKGVSNAVTTVLDSTDSTAHYECGTAVSYYMAVRWGNDTGSCAQNDDHWTQNPLVVSLCIPSAYHNGAKTAPAWYIAEVASCSYSLGQYSGVNCGMWSHVTKTAYSVSCDHGICNTADPTICPRGSEQKCPTNESIADRTPSPTVAPTPRCTYSWSDIQLLPSLANAKWMHLAYMLADNDLDRNLANVLDEMRLNPATADELNLVVYIDRSTRDDQEPITNITDCATNTPISGLFTGSKLLQKQGTTWCQIYDFNGCELDSMQSDTIANFVALIAPYQQSSTYFVLTLWDHGGAWMGFGQEEDTGNTGDTPRGAVHNLDTLFSAIQVGLQASPYLGRLDILGFDACIMADYTVLHYASAAEVAKYLIVSEVPEPADSSWKYTSLDASASCALDYAVAIVDGYVDQGNIQWVNGGYTLAVFDMDKVRSFLNQFNVLMRIATFALEKGDYGMLMAILRGERGTVPVTDQDDSFDLYDLGLFLEHCIEDNIFWDTCNDRVQSAGDDAWLSFDDCIVYFRGDFIREDLHMTGATIFFSTNPGDIARFNAYNNDLSADHYVAFLKAMNQTLQNMKGGNTSLLTETVCSAPVPTDLTFTISDKPTATYYTDIGLYAIEFDVTSTVMQVDVFVSYVYVPVSNLQADIVDRSAHETKVTLYWDGKVSSFTNLASGNDTEGLSEYMYCTADIIYADVHYSIKYPLYIFDTDNYEEAMQLYQAGEAKSGYIQYEVSLETMAADEENGTVTVAVDQLLLYEIEGGSGVISAVDDTETRIIVGVLWGPRRNGSSPHGGILRWPELQLSMETVTETTTFRVNAVDVFGSVDAVQIEFDSLNVSTDTFLTSTTTTSTNAPLETTSIDTQPPVTTEEGLLTTQMSSSETSSVTSTASTATAAAGKEEGGLNAVDGVVWLVVVIVLVLIIAVLLVLFCKTRKELSGYVIDASGTGYVQMGSN